MRFGNRRVRVEEVVPRPRWHWVCDICGAPDEFGERHTFRYVGPWRRSSRRARRDGRKHVKRQHFPYHFGMTLGESENERKARANRA